MAIAAPFPAASARRPGTVRSTRTARSTRATRTSGGTRTEGGVRLTPRGRLVASVGSVLVLLLIIAVSGAFRAEAGDTATGPATAVVVVQAGENLWQLAQQVAPTVDPRETVLRIRELNGLGGEAIRPGQSLVVPISATP